MVRPSLKTVAQTSVISVGRGYCLGDDAAAWREAMVRTWSAMVAWGSFVLGDAFIETVMVSDDVRFGA